MFIKILPLLFVVDLCCCHVSLIYPPAQWLPLDYMDNQHTMAPCGLPPGRKTTYTTMLTGISYNISWHLSYPHQGGYRISLLDNQGLKIMNLTHHSGIEDFVERDRPTSQWHTVYFPPEMASCEECIILLEREAREFGPDFFIRSCADVNIMSQESSTEKCYQYDNKMSWEVDCFYQGDCTSEMDCNGGECVDLDSRFGYQHPSVQNQAYPSKVCYCPPPKFGRNCEKEFTPTQTDYNELCFNWAFPIMRHALSYKDDLYDPGCYRSRRLAKNVTIYWREVNKASELEIILDYATTSWVGLGWRPMRTDVKCKKFPIDFQTGLYSWDHAEDFKEMAKPKNRSSATEILDGGDCADLSIGSARGHLTRMGDYYTRDRSTALPDTVYMGQDHLSAVFGKETEDGRTVMMFRKSIEARDACDHPLHGRLAVLWAKGHSGPGPVTHSPPSGMETAKHADPNFYTTDELKYHGRENRGRTMLTFTKEREEQDSRVEEATTYLSEPIFAKKRGGKPFLSAFLVGVLAILVYF